MYLLYWFFTFCGIIYVLLLLLPQVSPFPSSRLPAECFGGQTVSHDYNVHTQSVNTCTIQNPKSAYMLVYHRLEQEQEQEKTLSPSMTVPALHREVSQVEACLAAPVLKDNQQHTLFRRIFSPPHLLYALQVTKAALHQTWQHLCSLEGQASAVSVAMTTSTYQAVEQLFVDQLCQGVYFVLQFLSKSSSSHEHLYTEVG